MQTHIRRGLISALFAGGLLAVGSAAANASEPINDHPIIGPSTTAQTSGNHSIGSGNQVIAPVNVPVTVGAVSAAVLGGSTATNTGGTTTGHTGPAAHPFSGAQTSGDHSIGSGNQVIAPVKAPVTVGAVSAAVLGDSTATNTGANTTGGTKPAARPFIDAGTFGDHSIASGNQVIAPVEAPVTVGAVSAAVLGDSTATNTEGKSTGPAARPSIEADTSGDHSIGSGNQVTAPVNAPITVGAVSAAVLGDSTATNTGGTSTGHSTGKNTGGKNSGWAAGPFIGSRTSGDHSIASGNQVIAPVEAPVTVGAVSAAVLGDSTATNTGGDTTGHSGGKSTSGKNPCHSGGKISDHSGNTTGNTTGPAARPSIEADTSGDHSIGSGNQVIAPVNAPITVGAVSAAVLGDSTATNTGGTSTGHSTGKNTGRTYTGHSGGKYACRSGHNGGKDAGDHSWVSPLVARQVVRGLAVQGGVVHLLGVKYGSASLLTGLARTSAVHDVVGGAKGAVPSSMQIAATGVLAMTGASLQWLLTAFWLLMAGLVFMLARAVK